MLNARSIAIGDSAPSESLWRTQLGAEPSVVGSTLRIDDLDVTVVGVVRAPFKGLDPTRPEAIWLPLAARSALRVSTPMTSPRSSPWRSASCSIACTRARLRLRTRALPSPSVGDLGEPAGAHIVHEAANGNISRDEWRRAQLRHVITHTPLHVRERKEVERGHVRAELTPDLLP